MIMGWGAVTSGAHILWAALNRYLDADGMRQGAAVSFYAAFSMAPLLVVVAGCREGLHAGRNAQAVGEATTRAVVKALVWIVLAACASTVVLQSLGF